MTLVCRLTTLLPVATCHGLETVVVDRLQYSEGSADNLAVVNAPTVYNSALNFIQFWDVVLPTCRSRLPDPLNWWNGTPLF